MEGSKRKNKPVGQALVEFSLMLPVVLLVIFIIIDLARLLYAWVAIENAARYGVRYAVTGEFNNLYCLGYSGGVCDEDFEEVSARLTSIEDAARAGSAAVWVDPGALANQPGYYEVTICSSKSGYVYFPSDQELHIYSDCTPGNHPGDPGDRVLVSIDFEHPVITPFFSVWWPHLHLTATREGVVERFRTARLNAAPPTLALPTFTPTKTSTPTETGTSTVTSTVTETMCKVPPVVTIISPSPGEVYTPTSPGVEGEAEAWDPDNVDTVTCADTGGPNGAGIVQVYFEYQYYNGITWQTVFSHTEGAVAYCGFGGSTSPCPVHPLSTSHWPSGVVMSSGLHRLRVRAQDDEGVWGAYEVVEFTLNPPSTPTPTITPVPTCDGVSFGSFSFVNYSRLYQYINNTSYPGLELIGITVNWGPLNQASNLYSWNEYLDFMQWNGTTINGGNDFTSTTSANMNMPRPVNSGANANNVFIDWDGAFEGYFSNPPLNFSAAQFGFTINFSDPACDLYRSVTYTSLPAPTQTATITNTPLPTNTPTRTLVPTITRTPTVYVPPPTSTSTLPPAESSTPTRTPTPTHTVCIDC